MDDVAVSMCALLLRVTLGITMLAHGWNHIWGGGKIAGTARWFRSIGFRQEKLQAWLASLTELGSGALLLLGLLTPLAAAAVVGTLTVAIIANHLKNGFFIFRPGEGYEYVLMIIFVGVALATLGGGELSVDHLVGIDADLDGWPGLLIGLGGGAVGLTVLALFWRKPGQRS